MPPLYIRESCCRERNVDNPLQLPVANLVAATSQWKYQYSLHTFEHGPTSRRASQGYMYSGFRIDLSSNTFMASEPAKSMKKMSYALVVIGCEKMVSESAWLWREF